MKKKYGILAGAFMAFLFTSTMMSAQYSDYNGGGYDYDDTVVIINDYGDRNDRQYKGKKNVRNNRIQQERRWKEKILNRGYAIAQADGRITRSERRELQRLERDLGISRKGQGNNHRNRRGH